MVAAARRLEGTHMDTRHDWLTRQIQTLEAQVKEERERLEKEKRRQALMALVALSLPEILLEVEEPGRLH